MRLYCPAKINLHLRVGPLGGDGYHPLLSWMSTITLADELEITESDTGRIELSCDRPELAVDATNLIVRAGAALSSEAGGKHGARAMLHKRIPLGGGLGGGSSDAAGALIGFNRLWELNWPTDRLAAIGARLGADVAFFFHGPSSVCTGRGERVVPISKPMARWAVLFLPEMSISTAAVYRQFDQMKLGRDDRLAQEPDWKRWTELKADQLLPLLVNDLEAPAFALCPELGQLRQALEQRIGRIVRMSGSGSTLFTLVDGEVDGQAVIRKIGGEVKFGKPILAALAVDVR
jgi:4-diphosphocytidyl-2-C-methyl-D-erythritol kinase